MPGVNLPPSLPPPHRNARPGAPSRSFVCTVSADELAALDEVYTGLSDLLRLLPYNGDVPQGVTVDVRPITPNELVADELAATVEALTDELAAIARCPWPHAPCTCDPRGRG